MSEQTSEQADERADKQASGEQAAGERLASERCVSSAHAKAPQRQVRERQCGRRRRGRPRSGAGGGCGGEEDDGEDTQQRWAWRRHQGWPVQWQGERTRALANLGRVQIAVGGALAFTAELSSHFCFRIFHSLLRKKLSRPWRPPLPKAAPRASGSARGELPSEPWRPLPRPGLASNQRLRCGPLAPQAPFRLHPAGGRRTILAGEPGAR